MKKNEINIKKTALIITLFGIGLILRCFWFGKIPQGITTDEAMTGYNSWTLLEYNVDMWGHHFPWYLEAWGSGMNALYEYLAMPFVKISSLNIISERMPDLIAGLALLPLFFTFLKKVYSEKIAWIGLILLTVNPWAISISRQGLESNLLPVILLCALTLFAYKKYILAAAFFSLSIYAYSSILIVLPFLIATLYLMAIFKKDITIIKTFYAAGIFLIIALPMIFWFLVNLFGLPSFDVGFFSVEKFSMVRQTFGWSINDNLKLVVTQFDGYLQNGTVASSIGYMLSLPFAVIGVIRSINMRRFIPVAWLVSTIPLILMVKGNVNRYNVMWVVLLMLVAVGVERIFEVVSKRKSFFNSFMLIIVSSILVVPSLFFIHQYFTSFNAKASISNTFNQGFDKALNYAKQQRSSNDKIDIIEPGNQRYSLVLFYDQIPPKDFLKSLKTENGQFEFIKVKSFTIYNFNKKPDYAKGNPVIIPKSLKKEVPDDKKEKEFEEYIVVT